MENLKIRIPNEEASRQVQEAAFKMGYTWLGSEMQIVEATGCPYLFLHSNYTMTRASNSCYDFEGHDNEEIHWGDFVNLSPGDLPKEGEYITITEDNSFHAIAKVQDNNNDSDEDHLRGIVYLLRIDYKRFEPNAPVCYKDIDRTWQYSTSDERRWLDACIKADKYISKEEALSPQYVRLLMNHFGYKEGDVGKIVGMDGSDYLVYVPRRNSYSKFTPNVAYPTLFTEPATKEEYERQQGEQMKEFVRDNIRTAGSPIYIGDVDPIDAAMRSHSDSIMVGSIDDMPHFDSAKATFKTSFKDSLNQIKKKRKKRSPELTIKHKKRLF